MIPFTKNVKLVVLCLALATIVGCTATGGIDWAKVKNLTGTLLHVAALNYTGAQVEAVDALVSAFIGQEVQRPDQTQYPGDYQYPDAGYPQPQDQDAQYPGMQYPDTQYPDQTGYSEPTSWESWGDAYPQPATGSAAERNALSFDFALVQSIGNDLVMMPDGARLRDGASRAEPGDRFGIVFSTNEPTYIYVVNIDATGWAQTLFPYPDIPGFSNPVMPGNTILLPNEQLYGLDDARGVETIFVLASRTPNYELENALAPLRGKERSAEISIRGAEKRVAIPMVGQRGLVGIVPGVARTEGVSLDQYFTSPESNEFAFSRWFVHE